MFAQPASKSLSNADFEFDNSFHENPELVSPSTAGRTDSNYDLSSNQHSIMVVGSFDELNGVLTPAQSKII